MSDVVIKVEGLRKTYHLGDVLVEALRGVNLTVSQGEFVAIMGASGSGKSTLMHILGCLDIPDAGHYYLEGQDITDLDEPALAGIRSRHIGFVFQSFNLLPRTSAVENISLPLFYARRLEQDEERVHQVIAELGLVGRENNHPSQLSGGQQQRVAIARALVNKPSILLADEPTGNLDSHTAEDIMRTLQTLNREQGLTIILVTHEPDMAVFADRVITMRDGQIISDERKRSRPTPVITPPLKNGIKTPVENNQWTHWGTYLRMALFVAARALGRNKLRSALTMLGIFIGVAALITMVAVGQGANSAVIARIESLGTNLLVVLPGARTVGGARGGFGSASNLTVSDARAIVHEAPAVGRIGYLIRQSGQVQFGDKNWTTSIVGVNADYFIIRNWPVVVGRLFNQTDEEDAARVCLIGQTVARNLFGPYENPVGATILVKNVPMRVVGLLKSRGQTGFGQDQDDVVFMPFTTAQNKVIGVAAPSQSTTTLNNLYPTPPNPFGIQPKLTGYVNVIFVQARSTGLVPTAIKEVTKILNRRHHIDKEEDEDFSVRNISDITQAMQGSSQTMAFLLAAVASISLIVGGIGIMNILLVSVTERTREIGIRMAIGARRAHVLLQFLVEAMLLSLMGGVAGIILGIAVAEVVSIIAGWPTIISPLAIIVGFLFSAIVGIFFGYYPARRASKLNPIEALRYE